MDIRKIKKLIDLLQESNLTEMEIQEGEDAIRLSRAAPAGVPVAAAAPPAVAAPAESTEGPPEAAGHKVLSPMVGTYYAAPGENEQPFVQVGSRVNVGDTLCIIEAMKIFNQIESDKAGVVRVAFKEAGDPVEYAEPLFLVD